MEYLGLSAIKNAYAESLIGKDKEKAERIIKSKLTIPIFSQTVYHAEDQIPVSNINTDMNDISIDIEGLEREITAAADKYKSLMENIQQRLAAADEALSVEEERIQDMNIICGNYNEFSKIITYGKKQIGGTVGIIANKVFSAAPSFVDTISFVIDEVEGNGYEGNKYVLKDGKFQSETVDTTNRMNMIDGSVLSAYEYSRINATGNKDKTVPKDFNYDSEDVKCTITLHSEDNDFSMLQFDCEGETIIENIYYSNDEGLTYQPAMVKPMALNNKSVIYNDTEMFAGTNIVCFPATKYVKIALSSRQQSDDMIGYEKVDASDEDKATKETILMENASRKTIRIKSIKANIASYSAGRLTVDNIVKTPVKNISVFANEITPSYINSRDDLITYKLTINGEDYKVVPINSHKQGIKMIRFASGSRNDKYNRNIPESIKSASLTIDINTPNGRSTPFLANLKVCLGEEV